MLFTGLKHLHNFAVVLFLISILIKLVLLFTNSSKFDTYRAKVKVPEMIVTILFLVLGILMMVNKGGQFHSLFWVKLGMVFTAIPITIVGFKKKNKILSLIGVFMFIMSYGVSEMASKKGVVTTTEFAVEAQGTVEHGKALYENNCVVCHGEAGDKKLDLAADLKISTISDSEIQNMIKNGKGSMPRFSEFTEEEINALKEYVKTLRVE
jgi:hypothetical protein